MSGPSKEQRYEARGDPDAEAFNRFLGLGERFSVKSHYPQYKRNLQALKANEARLQAVVDTIPFDVMVLEPDGTCVMQNPSAERHFGDLIGQRVSTIPELDEDLRSRLINQEQLASGGRLVQQELELELEGERIWLLRVVAPIFVEGAVLGMVTVNVDISAQKSAQSALSTLNEELEEKVRQRTEELMDANEALTARSRSLERALRDLKDAQETLLQTRYQASMVRVISGITHELNTPIGAVLSSSRRISDLSGDLCGALSRLSRCGDAQRDLVDYLFSMLTAGLDLPDRAACDGLRLALEEAGCPDAASLADDLVDLGVLELPPPLVATVAGPGGADLVHDAWTLGSVVRSATVTAESAERASGAVRNLNEYLETPQGDSLVEFDLGARMEGHATLRAFPGVLLEREGPVLIRGDSERLDLVWDNLIRNAVYAAGPSGSVRVSVGMDGQGALVQVKDDGPGIAESVAARIFEPLFSTKGSGESKGLGLYICRRIVDTHGGTISFESEPGKTVFSVRLPSLNSKV